MERELLKWSNLRLGDVLVHYKGCHAFVIVQRNVDEHSHLALDLVRGFPKHVRNDFDFVENTFIVFHADLGSPTHDDAVRQTARPAPLPVAPR